MSNTLTASFDDCSGLTGDLSQSAPPAPDIPLDDFVAQLVEGGLSHDQATDFLLTLIPLMWHFVDLGFRGDICELLLPDGEIGGVEFDSSATTEMPSKSRKEIAAE